MQALGFRIRLLLYWPAKFLCYSLRMLRKDPGTFFESLPKLIKYLFFSPMTRNSFSIEMVQPEQVKDAVNLFYRDGFVVIADVLDVDEVKRLKEVVERKGIEIANLDKQGLLPPHADHGEARYSFGDFGHNPSWEYIAQNMKILPIIKAIWKEHSFMAVSAGGDFVLPGGKFQILHNDMGWRASGDSPPKVITVNYYITDITRENGPIRQIPRTARFPPPTSLLEKFEPAWMKDAILTGRAGTAIIRDPRGWHGGTPNLSSETRYMPNCEYVLKGASLKEVGGFANELQLSQGKCICEFSGSDPLRISRTHFTIDRKSSTLKKNS